MAVRAEEEPTFWERAAETRWGRYLTEAEARALEYASSLAGPPAAAAEIGCEGGRWSRHLRDAGWSVTCTDVDADALDVCRRRLPDVHCIQVDPEDDRLPFEAESVRLLLVYEVGPVIQYDWFPPEAGRVLEPGGVLVCTYYNRASARGLAYRLISRISPARKTKGAVYYTGPSYRVFKQRLETVGVTPVFEEGLCWFPFTRQSNSPLVPLFTRLEKLMGLRSLPSFGPFVLLVARRSQ